MEIERPFGVIILAILAVFEAIIYFGLAASAGVIFAWIGGLIPSALTSFLAIIAMGFSVILVIFGLFYLLLAWGLWSGKGWAWTITFILTILSLLGSLFTVALGVGIFSLIINVLILYYLTRPHVKAFFGKRPPPEMPPPPPP